MTRAAPGIPHHSALSRSVGRVSSSVTYAAYVSVDDRSRTRSPRDRRLSVRTGRRNTFSCFALRLTLRYDHPSLLRPSLQPCPQGRPETHGRHVAPRCRLPTTVRFFFTVAPRWRRMEAIWVQLESWYFHPVETTHQLWFGPLLATSGKKKQHKEDHGGARRTVLHNYSETKRTVA